jgi:outer membrane protein assembly factor BamB
LVIASRIGWLTGRAAESGARRWTTKLPSPTRCDLAAADGRIYAACRDGLVHCIDGESGDQIWTRRISSRIGVPPLTTKCCVFAAGRMHVACLDADTGEPIWWSAIRGRPVAALLPMRGDRLCVAGADGTFSVLDDETGEEVAWSSAGVGLADPLSAPAVVVLDGGEIVICSQAGEVISLSLG